MHIHIYTYTPIIDDSAMKQETGVCRGKQKENEKERESERERERARENGTERQRDRL